MKLYAVYDKASKRFLSVSPAETDEAFIRSSLLSILMDYPIRDVVLYHVGYFDDSTGKIRSRIRRRFVPWDSYKVPENFTQTDSKDVPLTTFDEFAKKQKEAMVEAVSKAQKEAK